jgi:predicted metal-dependent peptidase
MNLKKAHMRLMRHKLTSAYTGVMMSGVSEVRDDIPTACTDGLNKFYGNKFCASLPIEEQTAIVLHENLHVQLKHVTRGKWMWAIDPQLANWCMDQVVNNIIEDVYEADPTLVRLPRPCVLDRKFRNWSLNEVWNYVTQGRDRPPPDKPNGNEPKPVGKSKDGKPVPKDSKDYDKITVGDKEYDIGAGMDEHDFGNSPESSDEIREFEKKIDEAIQQGAIIAGRNKVDLPRAVKEMLAPPVNWREQLAEWYTAMATGKDDLTWRRYNPRYLGLDTYLPSMYSETIDEVIIACDMSGSIVDQVKTFLGAICDLATNIRPKRMRVLWWDTDVKGEQVFEDDFTTLPNALMPRGGGGTKVSCVNEYIVQSGYNPDCVIVFTDGYVEDEIKWTISAPTLWMVVGNDSFVPPTGHAKIVVSN